MTGIDGPQQTGDVTGSVDQPPACVSCRRPAAYVLDRLGRLGQALSAQTLSAQNLSSQASVAFPVWACENCVQHLLGQVLDAASVASVCRVESYQQVRAML